MNCVCVQCFRIYFVVEPLPCDTSYYTQQLNHKKKAMKERREEHRGMLNLLDFLLMLSWSGAIVFFQNAKLKITKVKKEKKNKRKRQKNEKKAQNVNMSNGRQNARWLEQHGPAANVIANYSNRLLKSVCALCVSIRLMARTSQRLNCKWKYC